MSAVHEGAPNGAGESLPAMVLRHDAEIYGRGRDKGLRELISDLFRELGTVRRLLWAVLVLLVILVLSAGAGALALVDMAAHQRAAAREGR